MRKRKREKEKNEEEQEGKWKAKDSWLYLLSICVSCPFRNRHLTFLFINMQSVLLKAKCHSIPMVYVKIQNVPLNH